MACHDLRPGPSTIHWGHFDATLPPVLTIQPGDTLRVGSVSGGPDEVPRDGGPMVRPELRAIHAALVPCPGPHILTGPVAVAGAEPGDALRIAILDMELADDWGFNLVKPGFGALPDAVEAARTIHLPIDRRRGSIGTPWGVDIPASPFFGILGTAPSVASGRISSVVPGSFGGNMDNRELRPGATLYLPVSVPGALLSVGDGHAAQGDGEVCLTAVETGLDGTLRVDLVKAAHLDAPFAETSTHLIAMAFHEDLDEAVRVALRRMIDLVVAGSPLSAEDAYRLCSIAADVRVTQVVNRAKGIHILLARDLLPGSGPLDRRWTPT